MAVFGLDGPAEFLGEEGLPFPHDQVRQRARSFPTEILGARMEHQKPSVLSDEVHKRQALESGLGCLLDAKWEIPKHLCHGKTWGQRNPVALIDISGRRDGARRPPSQT